MRKNTQWILFVVAILVAVGCSCVAINPLLAEDSEPPSNTGEDLKNALKSGMPILADFGANKCIPCRQIRPILREIKKEYAGKANVLIIDVWEMPKLAREYRIQLIPTLVFWDPSGKEIFRRSGAWDKDSMVQKLKEAGLKD